MDVKKLVTEIADNANLPEGKGMDLKNMCVDFAIICVNEALTMRGVSRSLPTEEEKNIELMSLLNEMFEDEETMQKKEYAYGFNKCYRWIKKEQI